MYVIVTCAWCRDPDHGVLSCLALASEYQLGAFADRCKQFLEANLSGVCSALRGGPGQEQGIKCLSSLSAEQLAGLLLQYMVSASDGRSSLAAMKSERNAARVHADKGWARARAFETAVNAQLAGFQHSVILSSILVGVNSEAPSQ
jgi:hypothetical protein